jgi:heme exporter protein D
MFFDSFSAFIEMGGHGLYVWMAYSIALAVVLYNLISPILRKNQFIAEQKRRLRREKQLAERQAAETAE